jgi:DNA repair exonuclease SbcCD ATPase subunit
MSYPFRRWAIALCALPLMQLAAGCSTVPRQECDRTIDNLAELQKTLNHHVEIQNEIETDRSNITNSLTFVQFHQRLGKSYGDMAEAVDSLNSQLKAIPARDRKLQELRSRYSKLYARMSQEIRNFARVFNDPTGSSFDAKGKSQNLKKNVEIQDIESRLSVLMNEGKEIMNEVGDYCGVRFEEED